MDDILILLVGFFIGYLMGRAVSNWVNTISFREILKDLGVTEQQLEKVKAKIDQDLQEVTGADAEVELTSVEIKIEQHQGQMYAYRLDDDQFLGQGKTREELIEHLKKNLSNVRVIVAEENGAKLIQNA
jgi:hypothetical protein